MAFYCWYEIYFWGFTSNHYFSNNWSNPEIIKDNGLKITDLPSYKLSICILQLVLSALLDMCPMIIFPESLICEFFIVVFCAVDACQSVICKNYYVFFVDQLLSNRGCGLPGFWWALAGFQWVTYLSLYLLVNYLAESKPKCKIHMLFWNLYVEWMLIYVFEM